MRIQLQTLKDLKTAARHKHSVISDRGMLRKSRPAAVVLNMSGELILRMLENGIYIYREREDGISISKRGE